MPFGDEVTICVQSSRLSCAFRDRSCSGWAAVSGPQSGGPWVWVATGGTYPRTVAAVGMGLSGSHRDRSRWPLQCHRPVLLSVSLHYLYFPGVPVLSGSYPGLARRCPGGTACLESKLFFCRPHRACCALTEQGQQPPPCLPSGRLGWRRL